MINRKILVTVLPIFLILFFLVSFYRPYSSTPLSFQPGQSLQNEEEKPIIDRPIVPHTATAGVHNPYVPTFQPVPVQQATSVVLSSTIPPDMPKEQTETSTSSSSSSSSTLSVPVEAALIRTTETTSPSSTSSTVSGSSSEYGASSEESTNTSEATNTPGSITGSSTESKSTAFKSVFNYNEDVFTRVKPIIPTGTLTPQGFDNDHFVVPASSQDLGTHPIDELIKRGREEYATLKSKRTTTLESAANAYRERRGRHPPPGFDAWWEFSQRNGAIVIEDIFDQIYEDIEPFWGLKPDVIRQRAIEWHEQIVIRNGTTAAHTQDGDIEGAWLSDWSDMLSHLDGLLPDVTLSFNNLDESRIMVPWEDINGFMEEAEKSKNVEKPSDSRPLVQEYQRLEPLNNDTWYPREEHSWEDWHNSTPHWNFTRQTCHPDSDARHTDGAPGNVSSPFFPNATYSPVDSYHGFISNWTFARSACANPDIRRFHGNFIKPRWVSVNQTLFPMFAGSKIKGVNNEIIVPAAKYWSSEVEFEGLVEGDDEGSSWNHMINKAIWRGAATGGDHNETNWRRFHRQRFMSMMNGTIVTMTEMKFANLTNDTSTFIFRNGSYGIETDPQIPHNFPMPDPEVYPLAALKTQPTTLGRWSESFNDGAFVHFMCHPQFLSQFGEGNECGYLDSFYTTKEKLEMRDQFSHKYLPDIDGNSYSGRYRAFLRSGSVPIKATIYTEWHDARLIPWVHFVPMDNSYADYWAILEYFIGYEEPTSDDVPQQSRLNVPGHDERAKEIAEEGRSWANSMLRHEDMLVYMHRLILEYARVSNDRREEMGWADDLKDK